MYYKVGGLTLFYPTRTHTKPTFAFVGGVRPYSACIYKCSIRVSAACVYMYVVICACFGMSVFWLSECLSIDAYVCWCVVCRAGLCSPSHDVKDHVCIHMYLLHTYDAYCLSPLTITVLYVIFNTYIREN